MGYALLEPWDEKRADLRSAIIANTTAAVNGAETTVSDFMPTYGIADKTDDAVDVPQKIKMWLGSMGVKTS